MATPPHSDHHRPRINGDIGPMHAPMIGHRTHVVLTDAQYARLRSESERSGLALAELVRRAVDARYGDGDSTALPSTADVAATLRRAAGMWADRPFDGAAYVAALRGGHPLPE